jgi:hypothetical protein
MAERLRDPEAPGWPLWGRKYVEGLAAPFQARLTELVARGASRRPLAARWIACDEQNWLFGGVLLKSSDEINDGRCVMLVITRVDTLAPVR